MESNDLVVLNKGSEPTFLNANGSSLIDVTLATINIRPRIDAWHVDVCAENLSHHHTFRYELIATYVGEDRHIAQVAWHITQNDWKKFVDYCEGMLSDASVAPYDAPQLREQFINKDIHTILSSK